MAAAARAAGAAAAPSTAHVHQQLAAALGAAAADKAGPSAQQLLPLVSAAAREPQLLPVLLPKLPLHQFAEALKALASLQSSTVTRANKTPEPATKDSTAGPSTRRQQAAALTKAV